MDAQQVFTIGQQGLEILLLIAAPVLLAILGIGLIVSVVQAATQLNEPTLSFVPKLIVAVVALLIAGPWMVSILVEYLQRTITSIPNAIS